MGIKLPLTLSGVRVPLFAGSNEWYDIVGDDGEQVCSVYRRGSESSKAAQERAQDLKFVIQRGMEEITRRAGYE